MNAYDCRNYTTVVIDSNIHSLLNNDLQSISWLYATNDYFITEEQRNRGKFSLNYHDKLTHFRSSRCSLVEVRNARREMGSARLRRGILYYSSLSLITSAIVCRSAAITKDIPFTISIRKKKIINMKKLNKFNFV